MANLSVEYADMLLPGTVFISLAGVLGIFGNIIVIALYWCKIQDENGDRYFIPVLAVVDLLGSMSMTAYNVMDNYFFFNYPSETCCRWLTFSCMINGFLSPALLLIIAVQRHKKVCRSGDFSLFWRRVSIAIAIANNRSIREMTSSRISKQTKTNQPSTKIGHMKLNDTTVVSLINLYT